MGHPTNLPLVLTTIIGFSLLNQGGCDREAKQLFHDPRDNDNITPSPLAGTTNGWRPVLSPMTAVTSRAPNYRYKDDTDQRGSNSKHNETNVESYRDDKYNKNHAYDSYDPDPSIVTTNDYPGRKNIRYQSNENRYKSHVNDDNNHKNNYRQTSFYNDNFEGKDSPSSKYYENTRQNNNYQEANDDFDHRPLISITGYSDKKRPFEYKSNDEYGKRTTYTNSYNNKLTTISPNKHPVINKLQQHMDSAQKTKTRDQIGAQSTTIETFNPTPASLLGSFSEFGHATVRSREPASKRDVIRNKKKPYPVTESNNEYSMHLVPPPVYQSSLARYPDMIKKPFAFRRPKPDLVVDEQRHVFYVHPPPQRPAFFPPTHSTRSPGIFFGGPTIPNFAGLNNPHVYPGSLAGGPFPGPEDIKYYKRPEHFGIRHPPTRGDHPIVKVTSTVQVPQRGDNNRQEESDSQEQSFVQPDAYKNTIRQEELVTGRPSEEVRGPDGATFTVGSSFLAGNKQENGVRPSHIPHHVTTQEFHGNSALSPFSTISPQNFEQAFDTGRPNPAILTNNQGEGGRITRPFFNEERPTSFEHLQNSGPISHKLAINKPHYHSDNDQSRVQGTTPHFLPTRPDSGYVEQSHHLNEVHHSSRPWSEPIPPPEVSEIIDIEVQPHVQTTTSSPQYHDERRQPSRRPGAHSHRRPQPHDDVQPTRAYRPHSEDAGSELNHAESGQGEKSSSNWGSRPNDVSEQESDDPAPTRGYRVKGSRRPTESSTGVPIEPEQPSTEVPRHQQESFTVTPFTQEDAYLGQDVQPTSSRVKDSQSENVVTDRPLIEAEGTTEDTLSQLPTERPTEPANVRRPSHSRKPSRYRPNPNTQKSSEGESDAPQSTERPHRRPSHSRYTTVAPEHERHNSHDSVRQKTRRRRPQHTTERATTLPPPPPPHHEGAEDVQFNQVAYPSLDEFFDKESLSSHSNLAEQTTTPRSFRNKNPYNDVNDQNTQSEDDFGAPGTTIASETLSEVIDTVTVHPESLQTDSIHNINKYFVHENTEEGSYDSVTQGLPERANEDEFPTTTTTTEYPEETTKSNLMSRYKPRLRYGANSTRPRFSVKDYKDRINRLPQTKNDDNPKAPTETEPTLRTRYQTKNRGSYQKPDENNKNGQDAETDTATSTKTKYPHRVRGSYQKPDTTKNEQAESGTETSTETIRQKLRPKFGMSRFRTSSTTLPTPAEDGEKSTEKSFTQSGASRIRMPTGKYYSRYRSTTENGKDSAAEASSNVEASSTSKPMSVRTKGIFSAASKRRYPQRTRYGSQSEASSTESSDSEESITTRIEDLFQNISTSLESTLLHNGETSSTNRPEQSEESTLNMLDEDTAKPVDNEIKTPATRTFLFMPTMPTTHNEEPDNVPPNESSSHDNDSEENSEKDVKILTDVSTGDVSKPEGEEISPSQRVADLTSAATSGGYFNVMSLVKRKPFQFSVAKDEHVLPLEAFFSNKEYSKDS